MQRTYSLIFKIYLVIMTGKALAKLIQFFFPGSKEYLYFQVLSAFHPFFCLDYTANAIQVILNLWQCVPVAYYIYDRRPGNISLWRLLFIFKILFDILGNSYAYVIFKGAYHDGGWTYVTIYLLYSILIYIPATIIWFILAFKEEYLYAFGRRSAERTAN